MDQELRNRLRNVVTQCRKLLEVSISQELEGKYAIFAKKDQVAGDPNAVMTHLSDEEQFARKDILDHLNHIGARGFKPKDALDQLIREIAFTHLNRLCAYKMMEAREVYIGEYKFRDAVGKGVNSKGVMFYLADHPDDERLFNTGHQDVAYRHFLDWLGGLLSEEVGVLFNPNDPANRLYPRQTTLDEVLNLLNTGDIKSEEAELREAWSRIWSEDETIGWVYQYFTPRELRDQVRKESPAPRNSYELAFRNQFFTPRYVVEFLTDNTLGRIWYEMRKGDTSLIAQCKHMVRRQSELFLAEGENAPKSTQHLGASADQALPPAVYIRHRPKKDPRELRVLDPACGSGHFLLYCFDLLLTIYDEAYSDPDLGPALQNTYPELADLHKDAPRLILAHNLHGVDIDLRCSQIAALALWLRCQRQYRELVLKRDRPKITRSNIVCAEPMPGEGAMLTEFVGQLEPTVLGQVVNVVFEKMNRAGEVGSLLKIEEDIRQTISEAKKQWVRETAQAVDKRGQPLLFTQAALDQISGTPQQEALFDLSGVTDEQFFEHAEARVVEMLRHYAEMAHNGQQLQRRLFTEDAVRGFAFVDLYQKRYDVVLMNPPFGLGLKRNFDWLKSTYPDAYVDLLSAFVTRAVDICSGFVGVITSRSILLTKKLERLRSCLLLPRITSLLDLGAGVMDGATVLSCAYTLSCSNWTDRTFVGIDRQHEMDKSRPILLHAGEVERSYFPDREALKLLPRATVLYGAPARITTLLQLPSRMKPLVFEAKQGMKTFNDFRFLRLRWEVPARSIGKGLEWEPLSKGGPFAMFYADLPLVVRWKGDGDDIAEENRRANGQTAQARQASTYYRLPGATYSRRSSKDFGVRVLPADCIIGEKGPAVLPSGAISKEFIIGLLNSRLMNSLVHLQANFKQYDSGILERLPWISPSAEEISNVEMLSRDCVKAVRGMACMSETDSGFAGLVIGPSIGAASELLLKHVSDVRARIECAMMQMNEIIDRTYAVDSKPLREIVFGGEEDEDEDGQASSEQEEEDEEGALTASPLGIAQAIVSLGVGRLMGRWNGDVFRKGIPAVPDSLFAPMPNSPPAASSVLPAHTETSGQTFCDGVAVDDVDSPMDIVAGLRHVLEQVWTQQSDAIESELCGLLGVKSLREYLRKTAKGGFWDDHVSRYSKSRRKAPIYWLLQSAKRSYAVWLFYHRLDRDVLFKVLVNHVEPKIRLETSRLEAIRNQTSASERTGKDFKRLSKDLDHQEDLLSELRDFEEKLRRTANLHLEPDLNDGVVLNIAPLHELVPWKEAKQYWHELLGGKYEWSSIGKQLRQKGLVK